MKIVDTCCSITVKLERKFYVQCLQCLEVIMLQLSGKLLDICLELELPWSAEAHTNIDIIVVHIEAHLTV